MMNNVNTIIYFVPPDFQAHTIPPIISETIFGISSKPWTFPVHLSERIADFRKFLCDEAGSTMLFETNTIRTNNQAFVWKAARRSRFQNLHMKLGKTRIKKFDTDNEAA